MDASSWDRLVPLLNGRVIAVDLPGRGSRGDADLAKVSIDDCADAVVNDLLGADLTDVVLVGHSLAGVTLPRVVARVRERIRRVVFVSAIIPPHGISVFENIDPSIKDSVAASLRGGIYRQDPGSARPWLCNDLDEHDTEWVIDHMVDDAAGLLQEPVDLSGLGDIPRTYVHLTRDMTVPPELQAKCVAAIDPADEVSLDGGHMAMVGQPRRLADLLNQLASS
jgi:pimeloyl-ACP methyl ester carboxylesterase